MAKKKWECPHCGKKVGNKGSLGSHIRFNHPEHTGGMNVGLKSGEAMMLGVKPDVVRKVLGAVADYISGEGDDDSITDVVATVSRRNGRVAFAMYLLVVEKIQRMLRYSQGLATVDHEIDRRISEKGIKNITLKELRDMRKRMQSQIESDSEILKTLVNTAGGGGGRDDIKDFVSRVLQGIMDDTHTKAIHDFVDGGSNRMLPNNPNDREKIRRYLMSQVIDNSVN